MREPRSGPLVAAQDLAFRFRERADAVLQRLQVPHRSRRSHSPHRAVGRRQVDARVAARRACASPDSGLLLLQGLDRAHARASKAWRQRVAARAAVPREPPVQRHARVQPADGPPLAADGRRSALGRGGLPAAGSGRSARPHAGRPVPAVGETGWQLSHGERSRVYMARALLQGADLVVLDESFAELDPDSLQRCLPRGRRALEEPARGRARLKRLSSTFRPRLRRSVLPRTPRHALSCAAPAPSVDPRDALAETIAVALAPGSADRGRSASLRSRVSLYKWPIRRLLPTL